VETLANDARKVQVLGDDHAILAARNRQMGRP
jgi:hypothetical protein